MFKKSLLVVIVVLLAGAGYARDYVPRTRSLAGAGYARDYVTSAGSLAGAGYARDYPTPRRDYVTPAGSLAGAGYVRDYVTPTGSTVDWEYDGSNSERKAESWNWPATYDLQDICVIPVKLDVGFWIRVNGCKDLELKLKQVEIHKYSGSVEVSITTNVNIKLGVSWSKDADINLPDYGHSESVSPSSLDAPGGTVVVSVTLTNVKLDEIIKSSRDGGVAAGQNCVRVGTITLRVRPNVTPVLAGGCG